MVMQTSKMVLLGVKGYIVALERNTGMEMWRTALKGGDFVNIVVRDDDIYASTKGEIFCLDPASGSIKWHNPLKGLGLGLVSIGPGAPSEASQSAVMAEKRRRERAAAAGAASAAAAG